MQWSVSAHTFTDEIASALDASASHKILSVKAEGTDAMPGLRLWVR